MFMYGWLPINSHYTHLASCLFMFLFLFNIATPLILSLLSTIHNNTTHRIKTRTSTRMRMFDVKACWSQAGVGTSFVLKQRTENNKGFNIVLDLGCTPIFDQCIISDTVILSHGHIDHFGGIFSHARAHRMKCGKSTPTYYVPEDLVPKLEKARDIFLDIDATCCSHDEGDIGSEHSLAMNIVGVKAGVEVELKQAKARVLRNGATVKFYLRPFHVSHRGHPALGYSIISRSTIRSLKSEYRGMEGKKLGELARSGVEIKEVKVIEQAEVLYSGDTSVDGLMNIEDGPDSSTNSMSMKYLRQGFTAPLILCELTFLDPNDAKLARQRGHMNIKDIERILQSHDFNCNGIDGVGGGELVSDQQDETRKREERQKIIFYHISNRHAPLKQILECMCRELSTSVLDIADVAVSSFLPPNHNIEEVQQNGCISIREYMNNRLPQKQAES